jgi:TM2 domain-containing membrane protein YozV
LCLVASVSFSQVSDDFKFANHLLNTKRVSESVNYLEYRLKSSFNDSLNFVYGKSLFYLKDFSKAKSVFSQIPINHQLIKETRFYYGLSKLYEGQTLSAKFISDSLPNEELTQLFSFGNNILKDPYHLDTASYRGHYKNFLLSKHHKDLVNYSKNISETKQKSPFIAGLMSAIIPGTGKMYSGKIGEGFASLLLVGIFSVSTIEQFRNGGFSNPQTYLIGIPALLFYSGNIYGSYFSVNIQNLEFKEETRNEVLFHLHIPFRSLYRQ